MTNQEILNKLAETKNGRYIHLTKKKDLGQGITKESDMRIRIGVSYANMKINENKETGRLPWGEWVPGLENLVISHKGSMYLRVTVVDPENKSHITGIKNRYYRNNVQITEAEVEQLLGRKKSTSSPVYNIKFENILEIGSR